MYDLTIDTNVDQVTPQVIATGVSPRAVQRLLEDLMEGAESIGSLARQELTSSRQTYIGVSVR